MWNYQEIKLYLKVTTQVYILQTTYQQPLNIELNQVKFKGLYTILLQHIMLNKVKNDFI
jgi:hypothetical protein